MVNSIHNAIAWRTSGSTNSLCMPKMMPPTGAGCHGPRGMEEDEGKSRGTEAGDRVGRKPFCLRAGPLTETGGHSAIACFGHSGEHVDPRRIDDRGPRAMIGVP